MFYTHTSWRSIQFILTTHDSPLISKWKHPRNPQPKKRLQKLREKTSILTQLSWRISSASFVQSISEKCSCHNNSPLALMHLYPLYIFLGVVLLVAPCLLIESFWKNEGSCIHRTANPPRNESDAPLKCGGSLS